MENALNNIYHTHAADCDTCGINKNPSECLLFSGKLSVYE